jgi:hypothetical protein
VLASASGTLAQNLNGNGVPNEAYSVYGNQVYSHIGPGSEGYGFQDWPPLGHAPSSHHHARHQ